MGNCYLKGKYLIGFPKALEPEEPDLNPYEDALVVLPFDGSIENVGVGADTYKTYSYGQINYYAFGVKGNAYNCYHSPSAVYFNNALAPHMRGDWTVCYWFMLEPFNQTYRRTVWFRYGSTHCLLGELLKDGSAYRLRIGMGDASTHTDGTVDYNDGEWHFVVVTKSGNTLTANVDNGNEIITNTNTVFSTVAAYEAIVINNSSSSLYLSGAIDNVCFWNRVLSDVEIAWLYSDRET